MVYSFKFGFFYKDFAYGWHNKELFRLPSESKGRSFGLKKMEKIIIGSQIGYCCKRDKFTIAQLQQKTIALDMVISVVEDADCPF